MIQCCQWWWFSISIFLLKIYSNLKYYFHSLRYFSLLTKMLTFITFENEKKQNKIGHAMLFSWSVASDLPKKAVIQYHITCSISTSPSTSSPEYILASLQTTLFCTQTCRMDGSSTGVIQQLWSITVKMSINYKHLITGIAYTEICLW